MSTRIVIGSPCSLRQEARTPKAPELERKARVDVVCSDVRCARKFKLATFWFQWLEADARDGLEQDSNGMSDGEPREHTARPPAGRLN